MKLLLDEDMPHAFRHELPGHDVRTASYMGWKGNIDHSRRRVGEVRDDMPTPKLRTARNTVVIVSNGKSITYKPGDVLPPIVDLSRVPTDGPAFEGTDVPVQYLFEYLDRAHNLYAFLDDFPQVSQKQALAAMRKRVDTNEVVFSDRNYVSGTPIFKGTRVPIDILFEFLAAGENVDEFVDCFPSITREQAIEALMLAQHALESVAYESSSR